MYVLNIFHVATASLGRQLGKKWLARQASASPPAFHIPVHLVSI